MAKIVFVNRYFFPDHSATSQLLSDLAMSLAESGRAVHVVTSQQRYDQPEARLARREHVNGVLIHRVWTSTFGRRRLIGRAVDYASFYVAAAWTVLRRVKRGDILVAKTDPPLLGVVIGPIARLNGAKVVNWLQDLFPEVAAASGIRIMQGALGRVVARLRDRNLRGVDLNIVVGERAAAYLQSRSTQGLRVAIVHNWADGTAIRSVPSQSNRLRTEWSMERTFVVGYSGNMGRVHDFRTIVEAADALRDAADIVFLFIGGGRHRDWIEAEVRRRGLGNVRFRPYQPRERLGESLSVPDAHLVSLRREMEGLVVPSKFYGIAAAARPTIFIGDHDGEIARIVRESDCGRVVSEGDSEGLAACIRELRDDGPLRQRLGENARRIFEERFEKRIALEKWRQLLIEVAQKP